MFPHLVRLTPFRPISVYILKIRDAGSQTVVFYTHVILYSKCDTAVQHTDTLKRMSYNIARSHYNSSEPLTAFRGMKPSYRKWCSFEVKLQKELSPLDVVT
jgi:hypothetical protein